MSRPEPDDWHEPDSRLGRADQTPAGRSAARGSIRASAGCGSSSCGRTCARCGPATAWRCAAAGGRTRCRWRRWPRCRPGSSATTRVSGTTRPGKLALLFDLERVAVLLRAGGEPFHPDRDRPGLRAVSDRAGLPAAARPVIGARDDAGRPLDRRRLPMPLEPPSRSIRPVTRMPRRPRPVPRRPPSCPSTGWARAGSTAETAYELISSELLLDGQARLNLATFVTTWMPSIAARLMAETADKNMIDKDEYPQTAEIEARCVNILSDLWNSPDHEQATGCSTTGSSEACMLGGLALKWRWRERMRQAGKPTDKPNLVMGINVQVCWEKFCRYWDVEPRLVPMEGDRFHLGRRGGGRPVRREHDRRGRHPRLDVRRQLRAGQGDRGRARPAASETGARHPDARRRRLRRVRRAGASARARVGLPDRPGAVDQRLGPQVRARLPRRRLGDLAQPGGAAAATWCST